MTKSTVMVDSTHIYLDHNATTAVDPEVLEEMHPFLGEAYGNPSSIHSFGQRAKRGLDLARERVAGLIGAGIEEIVFTSGGTESDNHAIKGSFRTHEKRTGHIITTAIEHEAVHGACSALEREGMRVTYLGVDENGLVDPAALADVITDETSLISVMTANNDVGTVQPVMKLAKVAYNRGIVFHSDAVQAVGKIPFDVNALGVNLVSFSSHKMYGPKGAGALYIRRGTGMEPHLHGGHHESRRRAGTENVPAIVGFGKACELARTRFEEEAKRIEEQRDRLEQGLLKRLEGVQVHGQKAPRLPGTLNASFEGVPGDTLVMALDLQGVAVSTGSACSSGSSDPSHVLTAMGVSKDVAMCSVRFSLGRNTSGEEIERTVDAVAEAVNRTRSV